MKKLAIALAALLTLGAVFYLPLWGSRSAEVTAPPSEEQGPPKSSEAVDLDAAPASEASQHSVDSLTYQNAARIVAVARSFEAMEKDVLAFLEELKTQPLPPTKGDVR